jgi:hypothetical protein
MFRTALCLGVATASIVAVPAASAVTFTRVADTSTLVPGGSGQFGGFGAPAIDGESVTFVNTDSFLTTLGVYKYVDGVLVEVADRQTGIPGIVPFTEFTSFGSPAIDENGDVAFWGRSGFVANAGIYSDIGGNLRREVDANAGIPGGTGAFYVNGFSGFVSLSQGAIVFRGSGPFAPPPYQEGVYVGLDEALQVVADRNTAVPGGVGTFDVFGEDPMIVGSRVVFEATDAQGNDGLYQRDGEALTVLVDTSSFVPAEGANIADIFGFSYDGTRVAFFGAVAPTNSSYRGALYVTDGGAVEVVVDDTDAMPGQPFNFYNWHSPAIDGGNVAFSAAGCPTCGYLGIFTNIGGIVRKVIDIEDSLDGKDVTGLAFGPNGLSGRRIAFTAAFSDGSGGVYVAEIPEQCSDGVDNDGDGEIDYPTDPGCASGTEDNELSSLQCDNGSDDDSDGRIDWRSDGSGDQQCVSLTDNKESAGGGVGCGLGPELALVIPTLLALRCRRERLG